MLYSGPLILKQSRHKGFSVLLWTEKTISLSSLSISASEDGLPQKCMGSKATKQCKGVFTLLLKKMNQLGGQIQDLRSGCVKPQPTTDTGCSICSPISCCQKSSPVLSFCPRYFLENVLQTFNCTCWSLLPVEMLLSIYHSQVRQGQDKTMNGF